MLDNSVNRKYVAATLSPPEGRFAIVTKRWARDAMAAAGVSVMQIARTKTLAADGEVVWSWRRDPGATLAEILRQQRGQERPLPRGEHV